MTPEPTAIDRLIDEALIENPDLGSSEVAEIVVTAILSDPDPRAILLPIVEERLSGRTRSAVDMAYGAVTPLHRPEDWRQLREDFETGVAEEVMEAMRREGGEGVQEVRKETQPIPDPPPADPLAERLTFLRDRVYVNKQRGYVAWGNLTVRDHTARIIELKRRREGIDVEVRRHREALRDLRAAGKNTLAELYGARVA